MKLSAYGSLTKKGATMAEYYDIVEALTTILVRQGAVKASELKPLEQAFRDRGQSQYEDFLLEEGIVTKEQLLEALAALYEVPSLDVEGEFFDHDLVTKFPKDVMLRNLFIPYQQDGDLLICVAANPNNATLEEIIGRFVSYDVAFMVGIPLHISDEVKEFYDRSLTDFPREDEVHDVEEDLDVHVTIIDKDEV